MSCAVYVRWNEEQSRIDSVSCLCGEKFVSVTAMHQAVHHLLESVNREAFKRSRKTNAFGGLTTVTAQVKLPIYLDRRGEGRDRRRA